MNYRIILALGAFVPAAAIAQDQPAETRDKTAAEISVGVDYEEGSYGTDQDIRSWSVPATVKVQHDRLTFAVSVPWRWIEAEGTGTIVTPDGPLGLPLFPSETQVDQRIVREGLGDVTLAAAYALPVKVVNLSVSGTVKLPTADEGLGTGETDYAVGADISKTIGAGITPFAGLTYTMPGSSEGYERNDGVAVNAGVAAQIGKRATGFVAYQDSASTSDGLPDGQRVATGVNVGLGGGLSLGAYGSAGLSAGAPDLATGLRLGFLIP